MAFFASFYALQEYQPTPPRFLWSNAREVAPEPSESGGRMGAICDFDETILPINEMKSLPRRVANKPQNIV